MRRIPLLVGFLFIYSANVASAANDRYWQQRATYDIRVTLLDSIHTIEGTLLVTYTNASPDTLNELYFHLYSNAFQPGSMMDVRSRAVGTPPISDRIVKLPLFEQGKYWIDDVAIYAQTAKFEITGTIMRVILPNPLLPGTSLNLKMPFREQIPRQTRRNGWMSREGVQYSMAQWYPKICEYDVEGWHHQEYIAHEFYGVWGGFHVEITLPARFTVGASGQCMNPTEVGHGYERIAGGEKEGIYIPVDDKPGMLTWKFDANEVHDFAWVADDDYVHQWKTWRDTITIHSLYKTTVAEFWKNSLEYTERSLEIYSDTFGPYPYHNFSTTMAGDGGMEYPQLIMITGYRPNPLSLAGVIAHEVGHQWFFGILGSNETREAFMDEGFTSYATTVAMQGMFGENQQVPGVERSWLDWFIPMTRNKSDNYRGYQSLAAQGYEEPLDIPHDWLRESVTEGQVYGKTQAILNMLQYTLGDSVFGAGMKNYYWQWRFRHPHLVDFKRVMEQTAHTDLDWFFDEWFRSTRTVDYEAISFCSRSVEGGYENKLRLHNSQLAVMPVDLLLHFDDGSTKTATIPLAVNQGNAYHKSGETLFLPEWDWVAKDYTGSITTPQRLSWFEIDTSLRLQDLHWLNNYSPRGGLWVPPGEWVLWKQLFLSPPLDRYYSVVRPIVWYDEPSKFNLGVGTKFGMNLGFSGDAKVIYKSDPIRRDSATPLWYDHVDGAFKYSTPVDWIGRLASFAVDANKMDGIGTVSLSLSKIFRSEYLYVGASHSATLYLEQQKLLNDVYPWHHEGWSDRTTEVAGLRYSITSSEGSRFDVTGETSILRSESGFSLAKVKYETNFSVLGLNNDLRLTAGTANLSTPYQRRFWLDRANNYSEQSNTFFRSVTDIERRGLAQNGNLFVEGGAGVRGYNATHYDKTLDPLFSGTSMLGANLDVNLPNPVARLGSFPSSFNFALFADAGWVGDSSNIENIRANIRTDAGLKVGINILSLLPWQLRGVAEEYASIPTVNLYWPIYENHPIDGTKNFAWRWAVSLGTAF
jgi:hypothetical protein